MSQSNFYTCLFLLLRLYTAQSRDLDDSEDRRGFNPTTAILLIVFVTVFFALGCLSVYMRACLLQALGIDERSGDDNIGNVRQTAIGGLDASVIETFPLFRYSAVKSLTIGKEAFECPVCLNEFKDDETLRLIPQCCHVFHYGCIDAWLRSQTTCPICRANLIPVPGESVSFELTGLFSQNSPVNDNRKIDSSVLSENRSIPKSMSTGWKLAALFNQTGSTGQTRENLDRFMILPQGGHVALPQVRSSIQGYRTESNYFYFERLDHDGRFDRRPFSITPPYRTGSIRSPDGGHYQESDGPPNSLLQAIRSPFDRLFTRNNNVSYLRSSDAGPV